MSELDTLLENLADGTVRPDALREAVARALGADPARALEIRSRLLQARRDELLSDQELAGLLMTISSVADSDATLLAFNDDATVVDAAASPGDTTELNPAASGADTESGVVLSAQDVTERNPAHTPSAGDDDATVVNADAVSEDDRTVVNTDVVSEDERTVIVNANTADPGASDRTVVLAGDAAPDADDDGFDILAEDALAAAAGAQTGASWPTAIDDSAPAGNAVREFAAGDVLKERFELISKLGEGGMGAVWKAKDRLKEEARDRNPFVAVKLLQGDFKDHPEAFIALQREASKQQRLAHPNIATVYDFDRDGDTVYMTMEAMDGEPMDTFIRKLPAEGLPEEEAMVLIRDLCEGLAYAHRAGLVHSDLKPGNAFLVKDPERELGRIKLLDFGIARASSTKSDAEGEKTLFDPGELGALTPTYATIEMFDGQDPDPRDDIYALAIIAYQLYTGKHPYGKTSAPKAKERGLVPAPIERLDKRQNRGFARGLAFEREQRTPSVEEFLDDITRKKSRALIYSAVAALVLLVIGALAWGPVQQEIQSREREEYVARIDQDDVAAMRTGLGGVLAIEDETQRARILADDRVKERIIALISRGDEPSIREGLALIREPGFEPLKESITDDARTAELIGALIARGDEQSIRTGLDLIEPFDPNWQRIVKDQQPVKNAIIGFYSDQMYKGIDPAQGRYDYDAAATPLAVLEQIYPDSAEVFQVRRELDNHKSGELARLEARFNELLDAGKVIPNADGEDIGDVLALIARIDAKQPVLNDARIPMRFADLATGSMQTEDFAAAKSLLIASTRYAPDNPTLLRLRTEVDAQLKRLADEQVAANVTAKLANSWQTFDQLADFDAVRDDLAKLAIVDPHSDLLARIPDKLQELLGAELNRLRAEKDWQRSESRLRDFAQFLQVPFVTAARARLSADERKAGYERTLAAEDRDAIVEARTRTLNALLDTPDPGPRWAVEVRRPLNDLIALLAVDDANLQALRQRIADVYLTGARQAREQQRFDAARELIAQGQIVAPQLDTLANELDVVAREEKALQARRAEELRLARIDQLKAALLDKAGANQIDEARALLAELGKALPGDDEFLQTTAPQAIGTAYLRQAAARAAQNDFDAAATLIATGLRMAPSLDALQAAQREYLERRLELAVAAQSPLPTPVPATAGTTGGSHSPASVASAMQAPSAVGPVATQATPLPALVAPLRSERVQILPRYQSLSADFASESAKKITELAARDALDLSALDQPLAGFAHLYPEQAPALRNEVAHTVEARVRELAQRSSLDVPGLRVPLDSHRRLFADRHPALVQEVVTELERRLVAAASAQPLDADALTTPIIEFNQLFPDQGVRLTTAVVERLQASIAQIVQGATIDFAALQAPLGAYRTLDPQGHGALADEVGRSIGKRLSSRDANTSAKLTALQEPLTLFRSAFAAAWPGVSDALAGKAATAIRDLVDKDIYAADKLRRAALKTLPGNAAITAIRIELPLQEIIDANKLLASGKLTAAAKKLQEAIEVDANHSDIAPFDKLLREQTARAQADYDRYVRDTAERKDRATRKKLLASATRVWSDNPAFVSVKEPRSGSCLPSLAGHGRSKRSTCYDLISKTRKGPMMVVVPPGQFKQPFAISKYEVMTDHVNRFCQATKTCKPSGARDRKLPATGISLEQAKAYAKWLSERASASEGTAVVYRLPTADEWLHAATANGDQPEQKSFNCRVTSGGRTIKGHALLSARAGEENGWGLVNHIGNARELATSGTAAIALGGSFEDALTSCSVNKQQPHPGAPDALTGFRLVREMSR